MTAIYTPLRIDNLDNRRFNQLALTFRFQSDVLEQLRLKSKCQINAGFVQDLESIPIVRGSNARAGLIHDYFSRINSDPVLTKAQAAAVYYEFLRYCYQMDTHKQWWQSTWEYSISWTKWGVVYVAPGYFHKHYVEDTTEDIAGVTCDPFVTEEKLDAVIAQQQQVTTDLKEIPGSVVTKPDLIQASEQVTADLKEAKDDLIPPKSDCH